MNAGSARNRPRQLLRDISKQLYYSEQGDWTANAEEAKDFSDMAELISVWSHCGIRDGEVVEHFPHRPATARPSPVKAVRSRSGSAIADFS